MNKKEFRFTEELVEKISDFNPSKKSELYTILDLLCVILDKNDKTKIDIPDALSAISFRMEQQGLKQKDLVKYFGTKSHVSEFLNGKRELSKKSIIKLNKGLGISLESLLK